MKRHLYLCAYDIRQPSRLRKTLYILKDYSGGGQKSVFECFLSDNEKITLLHRMRAVMNIEEDSFFILPLTLKGFYEGLGTASPCQDEPFYWVG